MNVLTDAIAEGWHKITNSSPEKDSPRIIVEREEDPMTSLEVKSRFPQAPIRHPHTPVATPSASFLAEVPVVNGKRYIYVIENVAESKFDTLVYTEAERNAAAVAALDQIKSSPVLLEKALSVLGLSFGRYAINKE